MRRAALVTLVLGLAAVGPGARAQDAPSAVEPARLERLVSVGRLWATVKFFHPFLASRPIDWDSALVAALPRVAAAATPAAFAEAVQSLLASLDDPVTRVVSAAPAVAHPEDPDPHVRSLPGGVRLISLSLTHYGDLADFSIVGRLRALGDSLRSAHGVVIDLRTEQTGDDFTAISMLTLAGLDRALVPRTVRAPGQRGRYHSGLVSATAASSGGYFAGTYTMTGDLIEPADTGSAAPPVVFVINERSLLPPVALALQDAGLGRIVCEGPASDGPAVTPMIQGVTWPDGTRLQRRGLTPDVQVRPTIAGIRAGRDEVLARAVRWLESHTPRRSPALH